MSQHARVSSVAQLRYFRASLSTFSATAAGTLDEVATDIQRTLTWLTDDRKRYWNTQVRVCTEQFVRAKSLLKRKQIFDRALAGATSSCIDEKKALKAAEEKLQEAQRKLARTNSWIQRIEKELSDYKAAVAGLTGAVDSDIPNAKARLDKMVDSLEAYIAVAPPETSVDLLGQEEATTLRPVEAPASELEQRIKALRKQTPSAQARQETPLDPNIPQWIRQIVLSEALRKAAQSRSARQAESDARDKVLTALPQGTPSVVYLERTPESDGDSGWYLGTDETATPDNYAAICIADLLHACPDLKDLLSLPAGSIILADSQKSLEVIVDADDRVIWHNVPETGPSGQNDKSES